MKQLTYFVFVTLVFLGCQEQRDLDLPVATIDAPISGSSIATANGIHLKATLSDNTGLVQYKLVLTGIDSLNGIASDSTLDWIFVEGVPDENSIYTIDEVIELPDSTFNGYYLITLACLDLEGNESLRDTVAVTIKNSIDSIPPIIDVGGPFLDTMTIGDGFLPFGEMTDDRNFIYANIFIGKVDRSDTIHWFQFPQIQDNLVSFATAQTFWQVDSSWSQGSYHMYCTAWDDYSGVDDEIPFYVSY